jgi:hypothetical protein
MQVQDSLLRHKCYIMPYVDVAVDDMAWEAVQKIGALGIIRGIGKSQGWANKTFFYPDSAVTLKEITENLANVFPGIDLKLVSQKKYMALPEALHMADQIGVYIITHYASKARTLTMGRPVGNNIKIENYSSFFHITPHMTLNRRQLAVVLYDEIQWLMGLLEEDHSGNMLFR